MNDPYYTYGDGCLFILIVWGIGLLGLAATVAVVAFVLKAVFGL